MIQNQTESIGSGDIALSSEYSSITPEVSRGKAFAALGSSAVETITTFGGKLKETFTDAAQASKDTLAVSGGLAVGVLTLAAISRREAEQRKAEVTQRQRKNEITDTEAADAYLAIEKEVDDPLPIEKRTKEAHKPAGKVKKNRDGSWSED